MRNKHVGRKCRVVRTGELLVVRQQGTGQSLSTVLLDKRERVRRPKEVGEVEVIGSAEAWKMTKFYDLNDWRGLHGVGVVFREEDASLTYAQWERVYATIRLLQKSGYTVVVQNTDGRRFPIRANVGHLPTPDMN